MNRKLYKTKQLKDVRELLKRAAKLYGDRIAYKEIKGKKQIEDYSFMRVEKDVNALGTKLLEMGLKGKHIAIIGENSYRWVISYLSIVAGLGVAVPLDKELTDEDIAKQLIKCDAEVIIFSKTFAASMEKIISNCPNVKTCIVMDSDDNYKQFIHFDKLITDGRKLLRKGNKKYLELPINNKELCEIVFTSGTTGANKGVMLSNKNIMSVIYASLSHIKATGVSFSVLPINHTYECSCHILGGMYSGLTICFNDSLKRVSRNMTLFKPNMSIMVPLFLESMYKNIWKEAKKNHLTNYLKYGIKFSNFIRKFGLDKRRKYFKPILENFGGNLDQIVCGGAPLRTEIIKALDDIGLNIVNGYGITECGPLVASNSTSWKRYGSVGRVVPCCQVRIDNPDRKGVGEVQVKGDNVMLGYYNDEESTRFSFTEDGWFKTGDLGYLDRQNFLYICGRVKNLIILPNGKNVYPEEIEDKIVEKLPYVKEVVVYGPKCGEGNEESINALVYIDKEYCNINGIINHKEKLDKDIRIVNRELPAYKRIANVTIKNTEFIKTTTKKIKRSLIMEESVENA